MPVNFLNSVFRSSWVSRGIRYVKVRVQQSVCDIPHLSRSVLLPSEGKLTRISDGSASTIKSILHDNRFVSLCNFCYLLFAVNYDTAKELLLLASSSAEQQKWIGRLLKKIPRKTPSQSVAALQEPPAGILPSPLSSPRPSPRNSPKISSRAAIRGHSRGPPPASKPRWVFCLHNKSQWAKPGLCVTSHF